MELSDLSFSTTNDEISSTNRIFLNFKDANKWIFQLEWIDKEQLIELFNEFNEILLTGNNSIVKDEKELIKNKNNLIKKLIKLPFKQIKSNENRSNNGKSIRILSLDHKLRIDIISQLIKNEKIIINFRDQIDDDNKKLLIEKNNNLLAKLVKLPVELVNVDLLNKRKLDNETESEEDDIYDFQFVNRPKIKFNNNLIDNNLKDKEVSRLTKQLNDEKLENKKLKNTFNLEFDKLKNQLKESNEINQQIKEEINTLNYDKNHLRRQIDSLKQQLDYERLKNKKINDEYNLELDKLMQKLDNSKFLAYGGFLRDVRNFLQQDNEFSSELFTYLNLGLQMIVKSRLDTEDGIRYLSMYLNIDDYKQNNVKWNLETSYELRLKSYLPNKPDIIKKIDHTFNKSSRHGRRRFATVNEILDEDNGFIRNDCINLEIYLKVIKMNIENL